MFATIGRLWNLRCLMLTNIPRPWDLRRRS